MAHFLIVGAGYLGRALGASWAHQGHKVIGLVRHSEGQNTLQKAGIESWMIDLEKDAITSCPKVDGVVFALSPRERTAQAYENTYVKAAGNVLKVLPKSVRKIIYLSSTGVWPDMKGETVNESTPIAIQSPRQQVLLDAEQQMLNSGFPTVILRLAGIYGPGRNRIDALKKGEWPKPGGDKWLNLIYRDDAVCAIQCAFDRAPSQETFIAADDTPVKQSEMVAWLCMRLKCQSAWQPSGEMSGKKCQNTKLKRLGFQPKFPSFRDGFEALLAGKL